MCDSSFVGGRYHTVGTLAITVSPDPDGDLLCTEYGVRSTWCSVTRDLHTPYCSILYSWSLSGHETYLIEREYRDWHPICGVQGTSMPLHICISAYPRLQTLDLSICIWTGFWRRVKGFLLSILRTTLLLSLIGPLAVLLWQCSSSFSPVRVSIYSRVVDSIHPFSTEYYISVSHSLLFCF